MWSIFEVAIRLAVGVLLVLAGAAKVTSTPVWRDLWIASYRMLPGLLVSPVARGLPFVEITAGLALVAGVWGGAWAATAVLGLISLAVITALARGLRVSCGCFGRLEKLLSPPIAARNLLLTAGCAAIGVHGYEAPALADRAVLVQGTVLAVAVGAAVAVLLHNRRRAQQRHLDGLLRASGRTTRTRAVAHDGPDRIKTWADQPITTGGA